MSTPLEEFVEFVDANALGVVSTFDPDRGPEAALVDFAATPEGDLIFGSRTEARKVPNLTRDPRVAVVIGCCGLVTYQVEGTAELLSGDEHDRLGEVLKARHPETKALAPGFSVLRVRPTWVRRWDTGTRPPAVTMVRPEQAAG